MDGSKEELKVSLLVSLWKKKKAVESAGKRDYSMVVHLVEQLAVWLVARMESKLGRQKADWMVRKKAMTKVVC